MKAIKNNFETNRTGDCIVYSKSCKKKLENTHLLNIQKEVRQYQDRYNKAEKILINGDLHFQNVLFDEKAEVVAIIDFDDFRMDTIYADIAWTIVIGSEDMKERPGDEYRYIKALIKGCCVERTFSQTDKQLLLCAVGVYVIDNIRSHDTDKRLEQIVNWYEMVKKAIFE